MRARQFFACFVVVSVVLFYSSAGSSEAILKFPVYVSDGVQARIEISTSESGGAFRQQNAGNDLVWVNNLYTVRLTPRSDKGIQYFHVHAESSSRSSASLTGVSMHVAAGSLPIAGIWTPSGRLNNDTLTSVDAGTPFVTYSAANYGIPYIAAATASGSNSLAIGLLEQDLPVEIRATPVPGNLEELTVNATLPGGQSLDQDFFVSTDKSYDWYEVAEAYAGWVDSELKYSAFPIGTRAYEPVYDTWYWSQDHVDERLYLETASAASAAGLGTFLADSGWDAPAGEYDKWLLGRTGDYAPPPEKFRNLGETFDILRSQLHLQIQLWLQPFAVGRSSARYPQTRALHIQLPKTPYSASLAPAALPLSGNNLEDVDLCPRTSSTRQYLKDLFTEMSVTYHPDAYWLDFIDGMPTICVAPHRHDFATFGEGLRQALSTIRTTLLSLEQNPVVQFRAQYANLNNKQFANVWQPIDSPNNFERMRLDALRLRPFSKGVVMASDQLYWPNDADEETVSRFVLASVMSGVPSIGANLVDSPASSLDIVKNWMGFYRAYKEDLATGRVRPFGSFRKPNQRIESRNRLFAYIRSNNSVALSARNKSEVFLLNASERSRITVRLTFSSGAYDVQAFDRHVRPQGAPTVAVSNAQNILDIDTVVESGGFLKLTRMR